MKGHSKAPTIMMMIFMIQNSLALTMVAHYIQMTNYATLFKTSVRFVVGSKLITILIKSKEIREGKFPRYESMRDY